jgi:protein SCO1/2
MGLKIRNSFWVAIVAIIAAAGGAWLASRTAQSPPVLAAGTWLPQARELPAFGLVDQTGRETGRARLTGRPSLVFFGFTNCPDVCPTTLALLAALRKETQLKSLQVVLISVDPQRDTPVQLQRYLQGFDPQFVGLTGAQDQIDLLTRSLSAAAQRTDLPGGDYTMDHSATVYLLNSRAQLVGVFTPPLSRERMLQDLNGLAARIG